MITDEKRTIHVSIGNQKIPIWIYGNENNQKIIFIHGYFRGFSEMVGDLPPRHLKKDYCVVAFDLPGNGYSKKVNLGELQFISKIIKKVSKNEKVILFGLSYGGLLAIKYYLKNPKNIKYLIIAGLPYFYGYRKVIKFIKYFPFIKKENKSISPIVNKLLVLNKLDLSKIKAPVLFLYSSRDNYATSSMGKKLSSKFSNSRIVIINKYNHSWLMHDIKDSGFLNAVTDFTKI